MTPTPSYAEDLAQETFIRAYRALVAYDAKRIEALRPRGWLSVISTNLGRNRARLWTAPTTDIGSVAEPIGADHQQPERIAERREDAQRCR